MSIGSCLVSFDANCVDSCRQRWLSPSISIVFKSAIVCKNFASDLLCVRNNMGWLKVEYNPDRLCIQMLGPEDIDCSRPEKTVFTQDISHIMHCKHIGNVSEELLRSIQTKITTQ